MLDLDTLMASAEHAPNPGLARLVAELHGVNLVEQYTLINKLLRHPDPEQFSVLAALGVTAATREEVLAGAVAALQRADAQLLALCERHYKALVRLLMYDAVDDEDMFNGRLGHGAEEVAGVVATRRLALLKELVTRDRENW
ncbi:MAG: hypothetical protein H6741_30950 [Alphaproteobacteria bacterium]|nr:hypothetical protein [Alphaproteobacteria bacterium]